MGADPLLPPGLARPQKTQAERIVAGLEVLLAVEAEARACASLVELAHVAANETRRVVRCGQVIVFGLKGRKATVLAVTGLSSLDRSSPLLQDLERALARAAPTGAEPAVLTLDDLRGGEPASLADFAFAHLVVVALRDRAGTPFAGLLLAREEGWTERDLPLVERLAGTYAHAWAALAPRRLRLPRFAPLRLVLPAGALLLAAAGFIPVPLAALAPVEVVARDPEVVAAPLDGVVKTIEVAPNEEVRPGTVLLRLVDTALRGRLEIAERAVDVAGARERRLAQAAFNDPNARRDLAVAAAELRQALAERDAAQEQLARTVVSAEKAGVAVYTSRKDWEGRPVSTGERIMQIATPGDVQLRVDMPVKDAIVVRDGAPVRAYLDADPLTALSGTLTQASYRATPLPGGGLAFTLIAGLDPGQPAPRIGYRGTAQVFGDKVPLAYYVLRRPLTAIRQMVGL